MAAELDLYESNLALIAMWAGETHTLLDEEWEVGGS